LKLLLCLIELKRKLLESFIAKLLLDRVDEGFESQRESRTDMVDLLRIVNACQLGAQNQCNERIPLVDIVDDSFGVVRCFVEDFLEFLLVVNVTFACWPELVTRFVQKDLGCLVEVDHFQIQII
jgi:hypothetical protein